MTWMEERKSNEEPMKPENYVSVDIETWGPDPSFNIAAIGAVSLLTGNTFYGEALPKELGMTEFERWQIDLDSQKIHQLYPGPDPAHATEGMVSEKELVTRFHEWVRREPKRRVFCSFSSFDWAFIYPALKLHVGDSPFSHSSLEIKSLYMGVYGTRWDETIKGKIALRHPELMAGLPPHTHNALDDAKEQGMLLERILAVSHARRARELLEPTPV